MSRTWDLLDEVEAIQRVASAVPGVTGVTVEAAVAAIP